LGGEKAEEGGGVELGGGDEGESGVKMKGRAVSSTVALTSLS